VFINCSVCGVNTLSNVQLLLIDGPLKPTEIVSLASTIASPQFSEPAPLVIIKTLPDGFETLQAQMLTDCPPNKLPFSVPPVQLTHVYDKVLMLSGFSIKYELHEHVGVPSLILVIVDVTVPETVNPFFNVTVGY
jgi:hypothetical protein